MSLPELPARPGRPAIAVVALTLAALTLAAYWGVWGSDFVVFDDQKYVTENEHVRQGLSAGGLWWALTATAAANWHPLTWLSLQADYQLYGLNAAGYHATNLALHVANVVLLFLALRRLTGTLWRSALVAALFGVHPLHVESVAWVAERKDVLSTSFGLLTLLAYARYAARPGVGRYLVVVAMFALGLMAKPMLVTLPFVLLLLDYWPLGRVTGAGLRDRRDKPGDSLWLVLEKLPLFALAAASSAVTLYAQRAGGAVRGLDAWPVHVRVMNALVAYVTYMGQMLWPAGLAIYYPHLRDRLSPWTAAGAGGLLVCLTGWALLQARRRPYVLVGWLWYLGTLVPVIGLVQVGGQALADRYTYVPLIGLFMIAAWGLADLARWARLPAALPAAVSVLALAACGILTQIQVGYWHDNRSLWERACAVTADNFVAEHNLGLELVRQGKDAAAALHFAAALKARPEDADTHYNIGLIRSREGRLPEAIGHFQAALQARADDANVYTSLGLAYRKLGRYGRARQCYEQALRIEPTHAEAHLNLGALCLVEGRLSEAVRHFAAAADGSPGSAPAHFALGQAYAEQGRWAEAAASMRRAVELEPGVARLRRELAHSLYEAGRTEEAGEEYRAALRLEPGWPEEANRSAWALATDPDPARRHGSRAAVLARQVCEATGFRQPAYLDTLAAAYAEAGRFDDAVRTGEKAARLSTASSRPDLAAAVRERLRLYRSKQPYRDEGNPLRQR